jgi:hypothetical protein
MWMKVNEIPSLILNGLSARMSVSNVREAIPSAVCYGTIGARFIHRGSEHSELGTMRPKVALVVPSHCG